MLAKAKNRPLPEVLSTKRRSEGPPSATTLYLESILDGKKKQKKERKPAPIDTQASIVVASDYSKINITSSNTKSLSMLHGNMKKQLIKKAIQIHVDIDKRQLEILANSSNGRPDGKPSRNSKSTATLFSEVPTKVITTTPKSSLSLQIRRNVKRSRDYRSAPARVSLSPLAAAIIKNEEIKDAMTTQDPKSDRTNVKLWPETYSTPAQPIAESRDAGVVTSTMEQAAATLKRQRPVQEMVGKNKPTFTSNDNFVKQNLRNAAGACRGARNNKFKSKFSKYAPRSERGGMTACGDEVSDMGKTRKPKQVQPLKVPIDPLDDYLDGTFAGEATPKQAQRPVCARHARPCQLLIVKKTTSGNKGRKFYCCGLPRGEQCDHFEWAEDTVEAAKQLLLTNSCHSGFVARQVASYVDRFKTLTVPELRQENKRRGLDGTGKKQPLLLRLSLWVRDEVFKNVPTEAVDFPTNETEMEKSLDEGSPGDDSSASSEELEIEGATATADIVGEGSGNESADSLNESDDDEGDDILNDDTVVAGVSSGDAPCGAKFSPLERSLFEFFGYSSFREGQEWAINRCLQRQRTLLVAPTGFGKSLCYSLPAAMMEGTCIVISPLISLIEDQLLHLPPRVPAATLSGGITTTKLAAVIDDVTRKRIKILFVSPERMATTSFRRLFQPKWNQATMTMERPFPPVSLLCVDEAHCLSQWAHNFRPSYLRIRSLIDLIQPASVLAVTATAGPKVIDDICRSLFIPGSSESSIESNNGFTGVKILGCDRDNIDVACVVLPSEESRLHMLSKLMSDCSITKETAGPLDDGTLSTGNVIIYVWRKRDTEVVAENLIALGVSGGVVVYHGGMDATARSKAQSRFMRGKARVCVCTVAFGLGINKSDVDAVVHLNLPASPEHYLQEIGRAGRDGRAAKAIALVLQNEVVVRHSLGHSDLIAESQVMTLLRILQTSIRSLFLDLIPHSARPDEFHIPRTLHIALPIDATVAAVDMKAESVETLLSLIEEHCHEDPLLRVEGKVNDLVSILLKRRHLQKLAAVEPVAMCIQSCARRVDKDKNDPGEDAFSRRAALESYSFGLYEFSVTRCAVLLGPHAESRHVFAALRRLQNSGELELSFQQSCLALHIKVEEKGIALFGAQEEALDSLATALTQQFTNHVRTGAQKVLDINDILTQVSEVQDVDKNRDSDDKSQKSARLRRFQALVKLKVSAADATTDASIAFKTLSASDDQNIAFDSASLMRDLLSARSEHRPELISDLSVALCEIEFPDYTALCLAKFFHGIAMVRTPYSNFASHPLFGKWRHVQFNWILSSVENAISMVSSEATLCRKQVL